MRHRSRLIAAVTAITVGLGALGATGSSSATGAASRPDEPASATRSAARADLPDVPNRPEVYMAFHGSEQLLGNNDAHWSYVRANLDGLWGNPFTPNPDTNASITRAVELARKVSTRNLILEHPIALGRHQCIGFRDDWNEAEVERRAKDIRWNRVAVAIYAGENPNCWATTGGIHGARAAYGRLGYDAVYTLFQPQNVGNTVNAAAFPTITPGSAADVAYRQGDGVVLECPIDACTDPTFGAPFIQAVQEAHARDVPFVWFTGYHPAYGVGGSGWLPRIQRMYNVMAFFGLWRADDKIMVINYHGSYRSLPERNPDGSAADTTTGIIYWLLTQRPISTLCTSAC